MVSSYKAGRRLVGVCVVFVLLLLAADAVVLASGRPRTLIGTARLYAQQTERPTLAMIVGVASGVGMVVLLGYRPISPRTARQKRNRRLAFAKGISLQELGEESRKAGESPRALRKRIEELQSQRLRSSDPYADTVEDWEGEGTLQTRQVMWLAGAALLWGAWGLLAIDAASFLLFSRDIPASKLLAGTLFPGCLLSFCVSAGLAHFIGWGPHYAEIESGDV